jgi:hypothetical protein
MLLKIPIEKRKELSDKYLSGISSMKLAEEYNTNFSTILNTLRRDGVEIRTAKENTRKYALNETFFDSIDTQEKAYFLGFLFADGSNSGKRISLNLSEKDLGMLQKLNILIHPEGKPLYRGEARESTLKNGQIAHTKPNYHLTIENKHISDLLSSYGCTPRKTNTLEFPNFLNSDLIVHFIRGYFDGDGSVSLTGTTPRIRAYISITSTRMFCEKIQQIIEKAIDIKSSILEKNYQANNIVEWRIYSTLPSIKFLKWIYKDSTIHLQRKYDRYQQLLKNREYLAVEPKCCVCGDKHYGKGYCNHHYQFYVRKVIALLRAKKQLSDYLVIGKNENIKEHILDIIKNPPNYKITYRPREHKGPFKNKLYSIIQNHSSHLVPPQ